MIARDTGGGRSFAGAGLYYLHDRDADTDARVAFTYTDNLLTDDADKALKVMTWTALHQADLKRAAGVKATGRKLGAPVHTFAFSWAKDETPDADHMIDTARSAIAALGLEAHEALYVGHDDTAHRHVHVIVNRVHPENGKAATLSKSHLALSRWAEAYEQEHGIHCHRRVENNRRRAAGQRIIDRESRRRNAEQFADWREKRAAARTPAHEQRRFRDWADRRRTDLKRSREERRSQLNAAHSARKTLTEVQLSRAYDVRAQEAQLSRLDVSLATRGVKGLWHRLTGRRTREEAQRSALAAKIALAKERHQKALTSLHSRVQAEKDQFLDGERQRAQELALRIERARARRDQEGWKSIKTDLPRPTPTQDLGGSFAEALAQQKSPQGTGQEQVYNRNRGLER